MADDRGGAPVTRVLDPKKLEERAGSAYPAHLSQALAGRYRRGLGNPLGIRNFGVNLLRLAPGAWSSQRHWHTRQDELIYILEGDVVLITDDGEHDLHAGMVAGFPAGEANGHHLVNRGDGDALVLEIGDRSQGDQGNYPDVDMAAQMGLPAYSFTKKDGTPFD
ncbi:MAG: cupin domain-containing protein [Proteobacteria bacterium]|nr:cupin domain-containing protein [Pseudomonadota bacterium]